MGTTNDAIQLANELNQVVSQDNVACFQAASAQNSAIKITGEQVRVTSSIAGGTGALQLPQIGGLDAPGITWILNDSANAVDLYPALGDNLNALAANAKLVGGIPAGQAALCVPVGVPHPRAGHVTANSLNWRVVLVT